MILAAFHGTPAVGELKANPPGQLGLLLPLEHPERVLFSGSSLDPLPLRTREVEWVYRHFPSNPSI